MKKYLWVLLALTAILGWSSYPALQQLSLQSLGPSAIWIILAIYGFAYSALMITFSTIGLLVKRDQIAISRNGVLHGLSFGGCSVLPALCFPLAMWFGPGPMVVPPIGYGLIPIANVVVCLLIDRRTDRPRKKFYAAVTGLIAGVLMTLVNRPPPPGHHETVVTSNIWIVFFVIMVVCWGFFGMTQQNAIEKNGNEPRLAMLFLGITYFIVTSIGVIVLFAYYHLSHNALKIAWSVPGISWGTIAGLAAATGTICSIFAARLQRNPMMLATIQFGSAPVVGVLITYCAIKPRPEVPLLFWAGIVVVTLAVVSVSRYRPQLVKR